MIILCICFMSSLVMSVLLYDFVPIAHNALNAFDLASEHLRTNDHDPLLLHVHTICPLITCTMLTLIRNKHMLIPVNHIYNA